MQIPLDDFLRAVGPCVQIISSRNTGDRQFNRIQFLMQEPHAEDCPGTLWICPSRTASEHIVLDRWILSLSRWGAPGVIVMGDHIPSATRLLSERLQFPLMIMMVDAMGQVMDAAYRLLVGADNRRMRDELEQMDHIQRAWRVSSRLEEFQRTLGERGISITVSPTGESSAFQVYWGRGTGERFSLEPPTLSRRVVDQVSLAIGVFLDLDAAEIESALRHRAEFLLELLVDPHVPTGSVIRTAARYNLDLGRIHTAFIWDLDQFREFSEQATTEQTILRIKGDVLEAVENDAQKVFGHGMVLPHSDEFVLIVESRERIKPEAALAGAVVMRDHLNSLLKRHGVAGITCGIGFPYDGPDGLRKSFDEAHEALTVGRARYGFGTIAHFKDLGLERFLYGWLDSPRSRELAEGLLRPLLAEPNSRDLFETLEVYLNSKGRMATAAQILHVHRNTLRYRLDRVQQLLKLNIDDAATQLVLQLAFKARPELH
ncbi:MAG: helix-turn-helix domain-containing protein [Firmicutes bacterium]|nr:helix-turn-helix domain-containing protein [Bacillota bacterium]